MADTVTPEGPDLAQGAPLADIPPGGVLQGRFGEETVLLSRSGDAVFAVAGACSHYGGPLAEGLIRDGTVRCPWHHACFDLKTGEALAAPAFAPLQTFQVEVIDGVAFVREADAAPRTTVPSRPASDPARILIVGGGAAGFAAADKLRRLGFAGDLTLVSADDRAPYDRPNLSKDFLAGSAPDEWMPLKDEAYYAERAIALRLGVEVGQIDVAAHDVVTTAGERLGYDALLLTTGAEPVKLPTPGFDHPHVRTLRSMADAEAIIRLASEGRRAVVIGASFIGLETAAALRERGLDVDVVAPEALPMERILGRDLALVVTALHEERGVRFHTQRTAAGFDGRQITLDDGARLPADLVVVGIGVRPRTQLAAQAGLAIGDGILVDAAFRTSRPEIFAAGDVAAYPDPAGGAPVRVEHWVAAQRQGQAAASAMLGEDGGLTDPPFFWSNHYDLAIRYSGRGAGWDRVEIDGSPQARDCTARYYAGDRLVAAASIGRDLENLGLAETLAKAGA